MNAAIQNHLFDLLAANPIGQTRLTGSQHVRNGICGVMDWRMMNVGEFRKNRVMCGIDVTERHQTQLVVHAHEQLYEVSGFGNERVYERLRRRVRAQIGGELPRVLPCWR